MVTFGNLFFILSNCLLIAIAVLGQDEEEDVQLCVAFVEQFNGSSCSCDSSSLLCTCNVGGQGNVTVSDPCLAALGLSDVPRNGQVLRLLQFPPPGGIDMTSYNVLLGRLTGDEEPMFHLRQLPMRPQDMNTTFTLYRSNNVQVELSYNDVLSITALVSSGQAPLTKIYVIAHDFNQRSNIRENRRYLTLKDRLLTFTDMSAVIFVDWSRGARGTGLGRLFDGQATANTLVVGREVGLICYQLVINGAISEREIHLIGNGLGAQMLHFAAKWYTQLMRTVPPDGGPAGSDGPVRKVGRLTALDPTAKDFQGYLSNALVVSHVFRFDAHFVDAIHTSSVLTNADRSDSFAGRLGMSIPMGFVDFYSNGGIKQPMCKDKFLFRNVKIGRSSRLPFTRCHHQSALVFFIASVTTNQTVREAFLGTSRSIWNDYEAHIRDRGLPTNRMGIDADPTDTRAGSEGLYLMPLYIDLETYAYVHEETVRVSYSLDALALEAPRVIHPNFRTVDFDSGQIITDFPPLKPTTRTRLAEDELPSCGQFVAPVEQGARVVGGHAAFVAQFPWTVCFLRYFNPTIRWRQMCTGTILNRVWLLTAAHCWRARGPNGQYVFRAQGLPFYATFGATNCMSPPRRSFRRFPFALGATVFVHPNYGLNEPLQRFDVSLIKLFRPLDLPEVFSNGSTLNAICWRTSSTFDYDDCRQEAIYAGFGEKGFGRNNGQLTWAPFRLHKVPDVSTYYGGNYDRRYTWPEEVRFKGSEPNALRSTCGGDSGGAMLWYIRAEGDTGNSSASPLRAVVIGTHVAGPDCDNPEVAEDGTLARPVTSIRIGHPEVMAWIVETMARATSNGDKEPFDMFESVPRPIFHRVS